MSYLFSDLQSEVKRRATRDQSGTTFDTAVKNIINTSLFRIAREANWKTLRRRSTINTVAGQTTGTVSATNNSSSYTGSSLSLITNGVQVGQRMTISGSNQRYTIKTITGENAFTTDYAYDGTTASGLTYTIYGRELYTLPIQTGREAILWHEKFGFPYRLRYITTGEFVSSSVNTLISYTPTHYHMFEEDMALAQPLQASVVTVSSSSSADTTQSVSVFGMVSSYPDSEVINLNGTTSVNGAKSFSSIERVVKNASTTGRVTVTTNSANVTVAVIPTGSILGGAFYKRIQLFPLPDSAFPINVAAYKEPSRLVSDGDIHELGPEFDEAIILLATAKLKLESNIDEGSRFMQLYNDEIKSLKEYNSDKLDWLPTLLRPENQHFYSRRLNRFLSYTQLGGSYGPSQI